MVWTLTNGPVTFSSDPVIGPVETLKLERYIEHFQVVSTCGGKASLVYFPTVWCTDEPDAGFDIWVRAKLSLMSVALKLRTPVLREGTCPSPRSKQNPPR
jgi:hypothetical protein